MTRLLRHIIPLTVAALFAACNDVADDDRFIDVPLPEAQRTVLLEEFTGQNCINCPAAHKILNTLLSDYPDNLIVVSIHAGPLSMAAEDGGLATPEGEYYADANSVTSYPSAVIDRNSGVLLSSLWSAAIHKAVQVPSHQKIEVSATYNSGTRCIDISTDLSSYEAITPSLQLWVTENDISDLQETPDGLELDYPHNHVFRAAVNGVDGTEIPLAPEAIVTYDTSIAVADNWVVDNLHIVAFLYDKSGVLQAAQTAVSSPD